MTDQAHHIRLCDVRFSFPGSPAWTLHIDELKIEAGEQVALIGSTGAGKSTLLNLLDGRLFGWSGRAEILGRALSPRRRQPRRRKADVGFVFQHFGLIERATVFENVRIGRLGRTQHPHLSLIGRFGEADAFAVDTAIRDVGLQDLADQRVDRLSGGQRQRVGVARCLAQEPRILLADEPVSNLDPTSTEAILNLLKECATNRGATLIVSSHQPKVISEYVQRVVGLKQGHVLCDRRVGSLEPGDLAGLYGWHVTDAAA